MIDRANALPLTRQASLPHLSRSIEALSRYVL